jgi:hypothetical protein
MNRIVRQVLEIKLVNVSHMEAENDVENPIVIQAP